jgi:hypothetical protein
MKSVIIHLFILSAVGVFSTGNSRAQGVQPYQVIAEDGAWCWFSDPRAVYHKGEHEKVYYCYIRRNGDVVISARDVKSKATETHVLHAELQGDDHDVPSILFLPDGKILTFYSEHNGRYFMRKSRYPEDISSWEEERTLSFGLGVKQLCYGHPAMLSGENNRIYLFFRGVTKGPTHNGWGQYYSFSDNAGDTWADGSYLLDTRAIDNAPYLKASSDGKSRIDIVFTDGHPKLGAASVYHIYYEKGKFHQTNGDVIADLKDVPLQLDKINKVYDVHLHHTRSWIWDIALNKKGRPVVAYAQYPSVKDHIYHYAYWDGKKWQDEELVNSGGYITEPESSGNVEEEHYSGGIVLDHENPKNVFLSRQVNGTFEIEQWQLKGNKWRTTALTQNSDTKNIRPYVVEHYPGKHPIVMWMNGDYGHYVRFNTRLLINERN